MNTDTPRPYGCKCQTLRERALGDGCDECNKALVIEMLTDERDELQAEVERLRHLLTEASYRINELDFVREIEKELNKNNK